MRPVLVTRYQPQRITNHVMSLHVHHHKSLLLQGHARTVLSTRERKEMEGLVAQILVPLQARLSKQMEDVVLDVVMARLVVPQLNYGLLQWQ